MRIFLLPLSTRQALIYCQRLDVKPVASLSYAERIQKKATDTWAKWESAEKGWKKQVVTWGNRGLQRIPYQEWGLKSFPPSNPKIQAEQLTDNKKFEVVFPGNVMHPDDVPKVMSRLAAERKTLHWNRFMGSLIAMPFTAPFALLPVIPNLPFFYVVYRAWSHWRALKGSDHLDFIIDNRLIKPISPPEIEDVYEEVAPDAPDFEFVTRSQVLEDTAAKEVMILPTESHNIIAKKLEVPELSAEVERAVRQVEEQLKKHEEEEQRQKQAAAEQKPQTDSKSDVSKSDS